MKKISVFLMMAMAVLSLSLVSCNNPGDDPGDDPNKKPNVDDPKVEGKLQFAEGVYMGKLISHYTDFVRFVFVTEGLDITGEQPDGTGTVITMDLLADVDKKTFFPKAGEYKMGNMVLGQLQDPSLLDNGVILPMMQMGDLTLGCMKIDVEDGTESGAYIAADGKVTVSGTASSAKIVLNLTLQSKDGEETKYTAEISGAMNIDGSTYLTGDENFEGYEKNDKRDLNHVFTSMDGQNFNDRYNTGLTQYQITLSNSDNEQAHFLIYAPNDAQNVNGTYTITNKLGAYTADRTVGVMRSQQGVSVGAPTVGVYDEQGYLQSGLMWFIESGTIVVSDNKITYDVKSHYGSTLKGTYEGKVEFKVPGQAPKPACHMMMSK